MPKWITVPVLMRSVAGDTQAELLGLPQQEPVTVIRPAVIDADRIESYAQMLDEDGEPLDGMVDVWLQSGGCMVLQLSFEDFDKLVKSKK